MTDFNTLISKIETLNNMNLEAIECSDNCLHIKMPPKGNSNHFGGIYAGALFSLAEFPFGMMMVNRLSERGITPVVGEMTMRYLKPAMADVFVKVEVSDAEWEEIAETTLREGKMKLLRETEVTDAVGNVLAIAKSTYFAVKTESLKG